MDFRGAALFKLEEANSTVERGRGPTHAQAGMGCFQDALPNCVARVSILAILTLPSRRAT